MNSQTTPAIVRWLRGARTLLEVGIGDRAGVAAGLVDAGADVRATDVYPVSVPEGVRFRVEDVTTVEAPEEFHRVEVVYALNCPPELHRPIADLAESVGATFVFTTLGYDEPSIPVEREQLGGGDAPRVTLYTASLGEGRHRGSR
ncbi:MULTISPECIES: UPF0146 family protein [Halolamina]|uniref:Uncharacterized protein n=1 Tax=Halolamina pelagica TaxID=699431 RepID=A0A1I5TXK9_9EURY|nr:MULTISPECIES: UPF0146 family protein [Halolamina]NHX36690.1 hypothetical protein [Halolamina sp. R1-12]SFP87749.1 hypothetical protein SAMN05216277_1115 [Halolamina pelagica]